MTRETTSRTEPIRAASCSFEMVRSNSTALLFWPRAFAFQLVPRIFASVATKHAMPKEENVLFPCIVAVEATITSDPACPRPPFVTVQTPVRMMQFEHDLAGEVLRELRRITSNYTVPTDGCVRYRTLYESLRQFEDGLRLHIHLENNILFPRAIDMERKAWERERAAV